MQENAGVVIAEKLVCSPSCAEGGLAVSGMAWRPAARIHGRPVGQSLRVVQQRDRAGVVDDESS